MNGVGMGKLAVSMLIGSIGGSLVTERLCERKHRMDREEAIRRDVERYINSFDPPLNIRRSYPTFKMNPYDR